MLKIKFTEDQQRTFWVTENTFSVGSEKNNHVVIDHASLSPNHARFVREGGRFSILDLNSHQGTLVNEQPILAKTHVSCGDKIQLGDVKLEVVDPLAELPPNADHWSLIADAGWLSGQEFPLILGRERSLTIGRGKKCDLVFPSGHLSRKHAKITLYEDGLYIEDLNSVNGTHVNGEKVVVTKLSPGDRIKMDVYSFILFGEGIDLNRCFEQKTTLVNKPAKPTKTKEKIWKTRSTSPGNRQEPEENKPFPWTLELIVLTLFATAVVYLLMANKS